VSEVFWQAKIWGLLHNPILKALHNNSTRGESSFWQYLEVMRTWQEKDWNPRNSDNPILKHLQLADSITSASDRGAIDRVSSSMNYAPTPDRGLEISHLLSGEKISNWRLPDAVHQELISQSNRAQYLQNKEQSLFSVEIKDPSDCLSKPIKDISQPQKLFWWLWRCLPQATCDLFQDDSLLLIPAEIGLPDSSIWSHASLTAALTGALAGYDLTTAAIEQGQSETTALSHPYLATFTFSPVQELIKASRKMRDFWAGSWILHYLSAKVSWKLAQLYGPDSLLYPSLYQQPLIDRWLLKTWPEFSQWVKQPSDRALLTAGFPNVLVLVLPKDKVKAAMQTAEQTLLETWRDLGKRVFYQLNDKQNKWKWMPDLQPDSRTWHDWIESQWHRYWTAVPIGAETDAQNNKISLKTTAISEDRYKSELQPWLDTQNRAYNLTKKNELLQLEELAFIRAAYQQHLEQPDEFSINVGSWWPHIFDQTRYALSAVKNARNWKIPTAFGPRSTVSGLGPVVHPGDDWVTEGDTKKHWQRHAGLFDGTEQLNATETIKRGLEEILPRLLTDSEDKPTEAELEKAIARISQDIAASYPDLTAGVAGYLKVNCGDRSHLNYFHEVCRSVRQKLLNTEKLIPNSNDKWGIPWIDEHKDADYKQYHPRSLNAGWLMEDLETREVLDIQKRIKATIEKIDNERDSDNLNQHQQTLDSLQENLNEIRIKYRSIIQDVLDHKYPNNNPANWYVLAAGDGDGMSEWLKGKKLKQYQDYIASDLSVPDSIQGTFDEFLDLPKRMGPSTHSALSRALLDFSNQLVPYLTERRYAGRLIYGGGDDVLAYTNLWEWDKWLWDIRQCFRGQEDPSGRFKNEGDYWQWQNDEPLPKDASGRPLLSSRPLFTMGHRATISFGIAIAHHSVPLAIALENLWEAEEEAKEHKYLSGCSLNNKKNCYTQKDAVQVRILYSNGNILKATAKFDVFHLWQQLLTVHSQVDNAIFEQAATLWRQHPAPILSAIDSWAKAFCQRRDLFAEDDTARETFQQHLKDFLYQLWQTTPEKELDREIQNWLKLAAFVIRNRTIKLGGQS
jgi:CRISPR-associated protein Cmr2